MGYEVGSILQGLTSSDFYPALDPTGPCIKWAQIFIRTWYQILGQNRRDFYPDRPGSLQKNSQIFIRHGSGIFQHSRGSFFSLWLCIRFVYLELEMSPFRRLGDQVRWILHNSPIYQSQKDRQQFKKNKKNDLPFRCSIRS